MPGVSFSEAVEGSTHTVAHAGSTEQLLMLLLLVLPMAGFLLSAVLGRRLSQPWIIAVPTIIVVWAIASYLAFQALVQGAFGNEAITFTAYEWIPAGDFRIPFNLFFDNLTAVMLLVVTSIGMLVHVYSIGYMAHDASRWRFFAYLNLFMFSMLLLVLAGNYLLVFAAWELVGLSSYLLIGFWYQKRSAALASKKAFLVNRVGDVGFALGIMAIWTTVGTLNFDEVFQLVPAALQVGEIQQWMMVGICLLLFCGAMGKSAQFPLHVWLPDAMEGPTPVSALIHAATMVNAGVYLVARSSPLFANAPEALILVAAVGIFTAIFAASIALTQKDIKRVLAYSTLSQLGYMFAALGVGAWVAAIFHLVTHGIFKGLLFLGSGSVIHGVHDEQDMDKMGNLRKKMPITHWTMLIGALAISGIPPLAGFFSKDEVLGEAFKFGFQWVWIVGIVVALMTAFYMFRLMGKTFYGDSHVDPAVEPHIHESPRSMTVPLILLAGLSIVAGAYLGLPFGDSTIKHWLEPVFHPAIETMGIHHEAYQLFGIDGVLILLSVAVATIGMVLGWRLFGFFRRKADLDTVRELTAKVPRLYLGSFRKWYFDELNDLLFVRFGGVVANSAAWFDVHIIDGAVNGVASATQKAGDEIRQVQTGRVQNYALGIAVGLIVIAVGIIFLTTR
ncbi:MAG: NADH-quinone oxidoreductase subunit L [Chloroflexi bacterium]|nr:NADH-quinone oxidoreductase subunit L [Chloroflexota bacterium]